MNALVRIKEKLALHPEIRYTEERSRIEVQPADSTGFAVGLSEEGSEIVVNFEGWHEHFTSEDKALNCFAFGLSRSCRLQVTYRGVTPVAWRVEFMEGGSWRRAGTTALLLVPFWRRRSVRYFHNEWLKDAKPLQTEVLNT
jgi:hypothetical protein